VIQHGAQLFLACMVWLALVVAWIVLMALIREEELSSASAWTRRPLWSVIRARACRCACVKRVYLLHVTRKFHMTRGTHALKRSAPGRRKQTRV